MDYNIAIRQNQLQNFEQFLGAAKSNISSIITALGWSKNKIKEADNLVTCCYDKTHRISPTNLEEHQKNCLLHILGYDNKDLLFSEPINNEKSSIFMDSETKSTLFNLQKLRIKDFKTGWNGVDCNPMTSDRYLSTFSIDERLALYNYSVSHTTGPEDPPELNFDQPVQGEKELTYEERLEQERNAKRRRVKYKSVHTNRKNHTEVIREVIANQMEVYRDCLEQKDRKSASFPKTPRTPSESRSRNSSRSQSSSRETHNRNRHGSYESVGSKSVTSRHSGHSSSSYHQPKSDRHSSKRSSHDRDKFRHKERHFDRDHRENRHREEDRRCTSGYSRNSSRDYEKYNSKNNKHDQRDDDTYRKTSRNETHRKYVDRRRKNDENQDDMSYDYDRKKRKLSTEDYDHKRHEKR